MSKVEQVEDNYKIQILKHENIPERFKDLVKEGEMLLKARSLTTDFLPEKWLKQLAKDSVNGRVLYRHRDPESEKWRGRPFGRILESEVVEFETEDGEKKGALDTWYRIFGEVKEEKTLQEYILKNQEKGNDIGISKGYIRNRKNGEIVRVFHLEDSITDIPECKRCVTQEVIQLEEESMPKDKDEIDEESKEIEKLKEELEATHLRLEEKDTELTELGEKIKKFEEIVEEKDEEKVSLEDKVIELKDQIGKFEESLIYMEKKPFLEELKKLEDPEIFELEKDRDIKWLKERLEKKKSEAEKATITTKSLEEEREDIEKNEEAVDVGTDKAFRNNPQLLKLIKQLKEEGEI